MNEKESWWHEYVTSAVAMCPPAVKMVMLMVGREPDKPEWWDFIEPVLALQTEIREREDALAG